MKILNKGLKSPILVILGKPTEKDLAGFNVAILGQKSSDVIMGKTSTWLNFDQSKNGEKEMERFITHHNLTFN